MKTIQPCTSRSFLIDPSSCGTTSSAGVPRVYKATLSRPDAAASVTVPVVILATGQLELTLPDPFPLRGIWQLSVSDSQCCCFNARIFIDTCEPMAMPGKHRATGDTQSTATTQVQACC